MSFETWEILFKVSVMTVVFCAGLIVGAYLISRRDEKLFKNFADILTDEQKNDMMFRHTTAKIVDNIENRKDK